MKPGKRDKPISIKIQGLKLAEFQKHAWEMAEAFGLDRKVGGYKGKRPIKFYQWDVECILDTLSMNLKHDKDYADKSTKEFAALNELFEEFKDVYQATYSREYYD